MRTPLHIVLCVVLLGGLGACGGGGGDAGGGSGPSSPAPGTTSAAVSLQPYVGEWLACRPSNAATVKEHLVVTAAGGVSLTAIQTSTLMGGAGCTEPVLASSVHAMRISPNGEKTIGTETVVKITITHEDGTRTLQIMAIRADGMLYLGDLAGALDADGYPDTFSTTGRTRQ